MTDTTSPSEYPDLDVGRIIETLDRHEVDYLLVGGLAASAHGAQRITYDFDALADHRDENLDRLAAALTELGAFYRSEGLSDDEARAITPPIDRVLLRNFSIATWRTDAGDLDVMTQMVGADGTPRQYDELLTASVEGTLSGVSVRVAALDDIIASKRHANRGKDQAALPELDRLARRQRRDLDLDVEDGLDIG